MVVLTYKHNREIPEFSEIKGLEDLTLVSGSVSIQGEVYSSVTLVLVYKGNSSYKGYLISNNSVSTVEVLGVHMHLITPLFFPASFPSTPNTGTPITWMNP